MNRELKFRAWDKRFKQFITDKNYEKDEIIFAWTPFGILVPPDYVDDIIIQQFTGIKDKHEKDIYEGDIVRSTGNDMGSIFGQNPKYNNGEIKWLNESWKICESFIGAVHLSDFVDCDCCPSQLEVLGNIFENPELLEISNKLIEQHGIFNK